MWGEEQVIIKAVVAEDTAVGLGSLYSLLLASGIGGELTVTVAIFFFLFCLSAYNVIYMCCSVFSSVMYWRRCNGYSVIAFVTAPHCFQRGLKGSLPFLPFPCLILLRSWFLFPFRRRRKWS